MKYIPEYAENIIVAIRYRDNLSWYIEDKLTWIMDIPKELKNFKDNGYDIDYESAVQGRYNIAILDNDTVDEFLVAISECRTTSEELKELLIEDFYEDSVLSLYPNLYLDFDKKKLVINFPELTSFESYIPDGWSFSFDDIMDFIPISERYWIIDGEDLILKKYQEECNSERM